MAAEGLSIVGILTGKEVSIECGYDEMECDGARQDKTAMRRSWSGGDGKGGGGTEEQKLLWRRQHQEKNMRQWNGEK